MRFLLDTTLLIDHAQGRAGANEVLERLFSEPNELLVCDVVVTEALSKGPDMEMVVIGSLIRALEYVATHPEAARWAGESRRQRRASGPRSLADAIIAGLAHELGATVVTRNPRDFEVQGVPVLAYGQLPTA
jgi:predicted nucleic acid-binding protein